MIIPEVQVTITKAEWSNGRGVKVSRVCSLLLFTAVFVNTVTAGNQSERPDQEPNPGWSKISMTHSVYNKQITM